MKKLLSIGLLASSLLLANNIKNDQFSVSAKFGSLTIHDSDTVEGVGIGYYFYDPNIYQINNKISLEFENVNSDATFYITSVKLDWIKNNRYFSPFVGINVAYLYFDDDGYDQSTNAWGGQAGLIYQINPNVSVNAEFCFQKAFDKKDIWNTPLKTYSLGVEYTF